jgi:RNA polymerase sigma-70 factor (ECF subfamily)
MSDTTNNDEQFSWDQNNKKETLEKIFHIYGDEIHNYALKLTSNPDVAADILQQVFLQLTTRQHISPPIRPLLYKIATDAATDWYRDCAKRHAIPIRRETRSDNSHPSFEPADWKVKQAETTASQREDKDQIMKAIQQLSSDEQAVIKAMYFDNLNTKEAAAKLGMMHGTLRSHVSRAIAKLQTKMNLTE